MTHGSRDPKPPQEGASPEPEVYIRALNGLATPGEAEQARAYLAANSPRHGRLQQKAEQRARKEQAAAHFLRGLPEFRESGDARIEEVSRELVKALSLSPGRPR
jgi:hypothetical protein